MLLSLHKSRKLREWQNISKLWSSIGNGDGGRIFLNSVLWKISELFLVNGESGTKFPNFAQDQDLMRMAYHF
jgi:hypothetical protein